MGNTKQDPFRKCNRFLVFVAYSKPIDDRQGRILERKEVSERDEERDT